MSDSLWHHELQHARLPCPSLSPWMCSNSSPLSKWCHPTILSSVAPFSSAQTHVHPVDDATSSYIVSSSCPQSFPELGYFQISQFFTSGGQSIGDSASSSVLTMNIQDFFPLGWTDWISMQSKWLPRVFSNTTVQKHQFFCAQLPLWSNSHIHTWPLEKPQLWLDRRLLAKWCVCFLISF